MSTLHLLAYLAIGALGGFAALVLFVAVGSSILRKEIDEHRTRKELLQAQRLEEGFPDFDSHLEPLSIGVELERRCPDSRRVHRRERATLPARRGDR